MRAEWTYSTFSECDKVRIIRLIWLTSFKCVLVSQFSLVWEYTNWVFQNVSQSKWSCTACIALKSHQLRWSFFLFPTRTYIRFSNPFSLSLPNSRKVLKQLRKHFSTYRFVRQSCSFILLLTREQTDFFLSTLFWHQSFHSHQTSQENFCPLFCLDK